MILDEDICDDGNDDVRYMMLVMRLVILVMILVMLVMRLVMVL